MSKFKMPAGGAKPVVDPSLLDAFAKSAESTPPAQVVVSEQAISEAVATPTPVAPATPPAAPGQAPSAEAEAEAPATPVPVAPATPPAAPAPVAEVSNRPVKEASYNLGYRIKPARLEQMERVLARCPGVKSKQDLMDKILNAGLDRLEAQLSAAPLQF